MQISYVHILVHAVSIQSRSARETPFKWRFAGGLQWPVLYAGSGMGPDKQNVKF